MQAASESRRRHHQVHELDAGILGHVHVVGVEQLVDEGGEDPGGSRRFAAAQRRSRFERVLHRVRALGDLDVVGLVEQLPGLAVATLYRRREAEVGQCPLQ